MDWYSDCKRISEQEVELPKHQSGSSEVSSHGHYTTDRKTGSGRPVTAMTDENLAEVKQEKAFSSSGKAEWRTYSAHFLLIS